MNYLQLYQSIINEINKDSDVTYSVDVEHFDKISVWEALYRNEPSWADGQTVFSANLPASISSEFAKLVTIELDTEITGSNYADELNKVYQADVVKKLRKFVEYGLAKGSLVIKPIPTPNGIRTQFIQAGQFFPIAYDGSGNIYKCAFADQLKKGKTIYTLVEIHTIKGNKLTIENKAYRSQNDTNLGAEVSLTEICDWAMLTPKAVFSGINKLPIGVFVCPMANQYSAGSPMGVSVYSRAVDLIKEADKRYSDIIWEFDSKQTAIHVSESMLKKNKETGKFDLPDGKDRLYIPFDYSVGANDKPLIDVYSPEIRSTSLFEGYDRQVRMIEFACSLAYGTLSDPSNVDKTAEEIKTSKQRSYTFVKDVQESLQRALEDWADACYFWSAIYGNVTGAYKMDFSWGDSILSNPDAERDQDMKDLANGTLRPEEYRAKWRNETIEEALANLPEVAQVML